MRPALLEHRVGAEEAVGGHEVDAGVVGPAGQQGLEHAGGGALAHRHAAPEADDERHRLERPTEERVGGAVSAWVAATRRFSRRDSGRYTSVTSSRSSRSLSARRSSSSSARERHRRGCPQRAPTRPGRRSGTPPTRRRSRAATLGGAALASPQRRALPTLAGPWTRLRRRPTTPPRRCPPPAPASWPSSPSSSAGCAAG